MRFTDEYGCDYAAGGMSEGCDISPWRDGGVDSGVDAGVEPAPDAGEDAATNSSVVVPAPSGPQYCCVNPDTCFGDVADPAAGNPCETGELRVNVAACLVNDAGGCSCFCGE